MERITENNLVLYWIFSPSKSWPHRLHPPYLWASRERCLQAANSKNNQGLNDLWRENPLQQSLAEVLHAGEKKSLPSASLRTPLTMLETDCTSWAMTPGTPLVSSLAHFMSHDSGHIPCLQPCPLTKLNELNFREKQALHRWAKLNRGPILGTGSCLVRYE